jgi:hypothetical protein
MPNKDMTSTSLPVMRDIVRDGVYTAESGAGLKLPKALKKIWYYLKGKNKDKTRRHDPAAAIILQIEDKVVAGIVRDLHYRTPKSLKAMRKSCESCFVLPDDCPYYDYSIFDVKKAIRRLAVQPKHTHRKVVAELQKINRELAHHLSEYLE